jgi:hypothetical protein
LLCMSWVGFTSWGSRVGHVGPCGSFGQATPKRGQATPKRGQATPKRGQAMPIARRSHSRAGLRHAEHALGGEATVAHSVSQKGNSKRNSKRNLHYSVEYAWQSLSTVKPRTHTTSYIHTRRGDTQRQRSHGPLLKFH